MKKKNLEILIENIERLFKQFLNPGIKISNVKDGVYQKKYELIRIALPFPIKEVCLEGLSNGKIYQLRANIYFQQGLCNLISPRKINPTIPRKKIAERFKLSQSNGVVFVLDKKMREEFAVGTNRLPFTFIEIASGPRLEIFKDCKVPIKTFSNLENFKKDLRKFSRITEAVLKGIYERNHREPPRMKLYIKPEEINIQRPSNPISLLPAVIRRPTDSHREFEENKITFKDIGGQERGKKEIQNISFALSHPALYRYWGTKPPKGVLLFGPPGTGKTLMAKALATETKANFYIVKIAEMTSKWYGESEKRIQGVFDIAKKNTPSIIFFDEIDAITSERDSSHEATGRMVSTMLINLDGINTVDGVIVIASTNRPDSIDPALKRPGRIDRLIEVPLPDKEGRAHILGIHLFRAEKIAGRRLCEDLDIDKIVYLTEGMSGADIAEIIRRALEEKVHQTSRGEKTDLVSTKDLLREIKEYERVRKVKQSIGFESPLGKAH